MEGLDRHGDGQGRPHWWRLDGGYAIRHPEAGGGVAFFAHVGGFVFGAATVYLVAKRKPLRPAY